METNQSNSNQRKAFLAVIAVLLTANLVAGYFLIKGNQQRNELAMQKTEVESNYSKLESEYHEITGSLDAASLEIGQLKGKNTELDKIIEEKQAIIEQEKKVTG
jgi:peptidoglycan hydrolase CwlO-like protein